MEYQIEQQARGTRIIMGDETKERRYVELVNLQSQIAENKNKQYKSLKLVFLILVKNS